MVPERSQNPLVKKVRCLIQSLVITHLTCNFQHSFPQQPTKQIIICYNAPKLALICYLVLQLAQNINICQIQKNCSAYYIKERITSLSAFPDHPIQVVLIWTQHDHGTISIKENAQFGQNRWKSILTKVSLRMQDLTILYKESLNCMHTFTGILKLFF